MADGLNEEDVVSIKYGFVNSGWSAIKKRIILTRGLWLLENVTFSFPGGCLLAKKPLQGD